MKKIIVRSSKTYPIIISKDILSNIYEYLFCILKGNIAYIITDDVVDRLYCGTLTKALEEKGIHVFKYVIPNGEKSKNSDNYIAILNDMAAKGVSKADTVIALGGGVPGDLAGFIAATYQRGLSLIQIPTTLLAAVDSSVGGKTAIDLKEGKNLAGVFYQPDIVICDLSLLKTLPDDIYTDGCAEVVKYGILAGDPLFKKLKNPIKHQIEDIVYNCIKIKKNIVQKDEKDTGLRQTLNLGHTIAHAIELLSGYTVSHGKAVAKGLHIIGKISYTQGLCTKDCLTLITDILNSFGFNLDPLYSSGDIANAIIMDKKRSNEYINLVLINDIGQCIIKKTNMSDLNGYIKKAMDFRG
ncbi:MAG: 3-dehydroquinate synthase [Clostridia bacterium]|jgi:3-dehydroquinate synthase